MNPDHSNVIPDLEPFRCFWADCDKFDQNFVEAEKFYRHVSFHADDPGAKSKSKSEAKDTFQCKWVECDARFKHPSRLKEHLRTHSSERPFGCPICGGLFGSKAKLIEHLKRQSGPKHYICNMCNKTFAMEALLKNHMRSHLNTKKCDLCGMTFAARSNLETHIMYKHSDEKPFDCEECEFSCKTQSDLNKHFDMMHCGEQRYLTCQWDKCEYSTKSVMCLKRHMIKDHGDGVTDLYSCHECSKRYTRGAYLTKHLKTAHNIQLPSGQKFRYIEGQDGFFRLQTVRYEIEDLHE